MLLRFVKYLLTWFGIGVSKARYEWINSNAFLNSQEWIELRYRVLRESDGRCCLCGRGAADGAKLNVDHIKPRRTHPSLALARSNLQVLCHLCNRGKGNRSDDWRPAPQAHPQRLMAESHPALTATSITASAAETRRAAIGGE